MIKVLIAGVGGASLGTELYKSLKLAECYEIYGCDISPCAYGLYQEGFSGTYLIPSENYIKNVINICLQSGINWLIPGGEIPMTLLGQAESELRQEGIIFVGNSPKLVTEYSDKENTFRVLADKGIPVPKTMAVNNIEDLEFVGLPCIVKPSANSGGSASVFFAVSYDEATVYSEFIRRNGGQPIAQEYIDIGEGEFTVGVLSLPDETIAGSIALRRELSAKLSIAFKGRGGIISSGYSQGYIDYFTSICHQAEKIARAIGSVGPINVQGRVQNGILLPFEINPRFSASTYLRAIAGFNEVDVLLKYLVTGKVPNKSTIKPGWYLRSLSEQYVQNGKIA